MKYTDTRFESLEMIHYTGCNLAQSNFSACSLPWGSMWLSQLDLCLCHRLKTKGCQSDFIIGPLSKVPNSIGLE